jgi:uncharacterized protein (TIGR03067 family)/uncharacterized repeat protein (TIGR02543 family)
VVEKSSAVFGHGVKPLTISFNKRKGTAMLFLLNRFISCHSLWWRRLTAPVTILSFLMLLSCNENNPVKKNPVFSVIYNGNGNTNGGVPVDNTTYAQGATVTIKGNTGFLEKTGYNFTGWTVIADGSGKLYAAGADTLIMGNENVLLYAAWAPKLPSELEGTWDGMNDNGIDQTQWTYTMALDSISIDADAQEKYRGTFTLDTTVSPRHIDIAISESSTASSVGKKISALYRLSGNIMKITANDPGSSRPETLDSPTPAITLILR